MKTSRMEAFSDGVLAIVITIMVLEIKVPHEPEAKALLPLLPVAGSYLMSFLYIGIYWNNHHHLLQAADRVSGLVLWANLHLLFWLSLIPFVTGWMGENRFAPLPTALYGTMLLLSALAWKLLQLALVVAQPECSRLQQAVGHDAKGWISLGLYAAGVGLAFVLPWAAITLYILTGLLWFIPDRRYETAIEAHTAE